MILSNGRTALAVSAALITAACFGCASTQKVSLPAPPPPLPSSELSRWGALPPMGPESEARLPLTPVRTRLKNGLGITVVSRKDSTMTTIALRVPNMRDVNEGPVEVMAEALRAGTRMPDGQLLLNPKIGGRPIDVKTGPGETSFRWEVLPRATEQALKVLASFVLRPDFDEVEVDVQRRLALARIASRADSGWHFQNLALAKIPGFERSSPKEDAVRLLDLKPPLLRRIHACTARPEGAELVIVGPVTVEATTAQAERAFGSWEDAAPSNAPCEWPQPIASTREGARFARLDRTELQLIYGDLDPFITIALDGPSLESEDYLPFVVLSEVLQHRAQGSVKRLRHAGSTYGIWATVLHAVPGRTALLLRGQLDGELAQEALRALLQDISVLSRELDESELESRKRAWRNEVVTSISSDMNAAKLLLSEMARKRDVAAVPDLPNEIMRIDAARCREVAERWLSAAHPSIVVAAGKPRTFLRGLGVDAHVELKYFSSR